MIQTRKSKIKRKIQKDYSNHLKFYFSRKWTNYSKKFHFLPALSYTYSEYGDYIETGVYAPMFVVKFQWFHYEIGVYNYHEIN